MDDEGGKSKEKDDVSDIRRGELEKETGMKLTERSSELAPETK